MSYHVVSDSGETLGFSLKPPKWLRKAQPGKILGKAALPLGVIAGALLIPGVGGALVGGLKAGVSAASRLMSAKPIPGIPTIGSQVKTLVSDMDRVQPFAPSSPATNSVAVMPAPMVSAPPTIDSSAGSSAQAPAGADAMPGWLIPAGLALAVVMFSRGGRR